MADGDQIILEESVVEGKRLGRRFPMPTNLAERWWLRVEKRPDSCWEWIGARWSKGYGKFSVGSKRVGAHRWGYEMLVGPVPAGLELDHLCRHRWCVNPAHLEPVDHLTNVRRGVVGHVNGLRQRSKTHCPQGHPYNDRNTYTTPRGSRTCRVCQREAKRRRKAGA